MVKISCVIPTINIELLQNCIKHLYSNSGCPIDELIIVADAPSDQHYSALANLQRFHNARIIINPHRVGLVKSFNLGLKAATNEFVLQHAEDLWGMKNYVKTLVKSLQDNPSYGTTTVVQSNQPQWVHTQMLSLNLKSMLEEVGYFDELYNPGEYDDNDFILKQWVCGYAPHSIKEALAFHVPHAKKYSFYASDHAQLFFERWKISNWNWLKMPSHSVTEKCCCEQAKVINDVAGTTLEHLKERWSIIKNDQLGAHF